MDYDEQFYKDQYEGSIRSATRFLSLLFDDYRPASVIDFGCGVGSWLYAAEKLGVGSLIGLDGPWVDRAQLLTPAIDFHTVDFSTLSHVEQSCDLAISVEVAEHLDQACADRFVALLAGSADLVVFGAAVPGQGGTNHINEQWQSYWIEKFSVQGFRCIDYFRPTLWDDTDVEYWYRQNTFLFVRSSRLAAYPFVDGLDQAFVTDVVHPELFQKKRKPVLQRADILREAAIELESEDLELAFLMMARASAARPDGDFINRKLREYRDALAHRQEPSTQD
jgi:SAM-dependent methyltransferase